MSPNETAENGLFMALFLHYSCRIDDEHIQPVGLDMLIINVADAIDPWH